MSATGRKLIQSVDWPKVSSVLSKRPEITKSLMSLNKKYQDVDRELSALREQKLDIDFNHYRGILKNKQIVTEMESKLKNYKITSLDTAPALALLAEFEKNATASATEYASELTVKLSGLKETVDNINNARPVEDMTTADVVEARPETLTEVQEMVSKGEYDVPGYDAKFPNISLV
ncbi:ATP synthase subunit d, mitochondrial [Smittium mucronatum]|uniref:ATP synthase subunit d, mitochondrial n=1 Tax=Smittium mucronatum TaxID=133383 RepID=A0A1R0H1W3_9FUNG|nr:ATP synthase subunit d, mitochondrial [Smittium mucronatum]